MADKMKYKVLITTSGTGSRLGEITQFTNKALVKVGKKPAISYIVESYPKNTEFVVTIGYHGEQVKDFLRLAYPDRKFTFVAIARYQGKGSSLGYSMLQAEKNLRLPFIFHACDTVILEKIPKPTKNWVAGCSGEGSSQYRSFDVVDERIQKFYDKGALDTDYLHIGLIGVHDYKMFWDILRKTYNDNPNNSSLSDVDVLQAMIHKTDFKVVQFRRWYDIGNVESLQKTRDEIDDSFRILDKPDESIFIFPKFVIKFFADASIARDRVERSKVLSGLVPMIEGSTKNFYRYRYAAGHLYSKVATPHDFPKFLAWSESNLWKPVREVSPEEFKQICFDFYHNKTRQRVEKFLKTRSVKDGDMIINDENVPAIKNILERIDFQWLCRAEQRQFHGDFILDNILKVNNQKYILLDWRQNFGGLLRAGDMYYDLAKLNHNLTVSHEIINRDLFSVDIDGDVITCDILRKENLVQCEKALFWFLSERGYDERKVKILTALIWLNMSPLHHHPFDLFLFYFGKLNLWRAINE